MSGAWVERRDPQSGRKFFYDLDSGRSSYELPHNLLIDCWEVMKDVSSSRIFFYNTREGFSQWERPEGAFYDPHHGASTNGQHHDGWEEVWDDELNRKYWHNARTGESRWVRPFPNERASKLEGSSLQNPKPGDVVDVEELEIEISSNWRVMKDNVTNRMFFYNLETGKSQWERPQELDSEEVKFGCVFDSDADKWEILRDPETGRVFFFNREEGTSQWERPPELLKDIDKNCEGEDVWEEIFDPNMRRTFFYNRVNGTSKWNDSNSSSPRSVDAETQVDPPLVVEDPTENSSTVIQPSVSSTTQTDLEGFVEKNRETLSHPSPLSSGVWPAETQDATPLKVNLPTEKHVETNEEEERNHVEDGMDEDGWKELIDKRTQKTYFFNVKTGESQWIDPRKTTELKNGWCQLEDEKSKKKYFYNRITGESRWHLVENSQHKLKSNTKSEDALRNEGVLFLNGQNGSGTGEIHQTGEIEEKIEPASEIESTAGLQVESKSHKDSSSRPGDEEAENLDHQDTGESGRRQSEEATDEKRGSSLHGSVQSGSDMDEDDEVSRAPPSHRLQKSERTSSVELKQLSHELSPERRVSSHYPASSASHPKKELRREHQVKKSERSPSFELKALPLETEQEESAALRRSSAMPSFNLPMKDKLRKGSRESFSDSDSGSERPSSGVEVSTLRMGEGSSHLDSTIASTEGEGTLSRVDEESSSDAVDVSPPDHPPPDSRRGHRELPQDLRPDVVFSNLHRILEEPEAQGGYLRPLSHLPGPVEKISVENGHSESTEKGGSHSALSPQDTSSLKDPVIHCGELEKRARHGRQVWQKRWFVLNRSCLKYFESERLTLHALAKPLARIDLANVTGVEVEDDEELEFSIQGRGTLGALCFLRAHSESDMDTWLKQISEASEVARLEFASASGSLQEENAQENAIYGRCIRSMDAYDAGMLDLREGDVVRILQMPDEDIYWVAEKDGHIGSISRAAVQIIRPSTGQFANSSSDDGERTSISSGPSRKQRRDSPHGFQAIERRMEGRRHREELEALIASLPIEPMKSPETYPTDLVLQKQEEDLRASNVRNHKLLAEMRQLKYNRDESQQINREMMTAQPNAYLLFSYSKLLSTLRNEPRLIVQIAACLSLEMQQRFAEVMSESLYCEYSVDSVSFQGLVFAALEMLWDQGLPPMEVVRQHLNMSRAHSTGPHQDQSFLPALLTCFVQRHECKWYLDQIFHSIRAEFLDILLAAGDTRMKVLELACLLVDALASEEGLTLVPSSLFGIAATLFDIGGSSTLHRFIVDVVLVPALLHRNFLTHAEAFSDPALCRRARIRTEQLALYLTKDWIAKEASTQPESNSQRVIRQLLAKYSRHLIEGAEEERSSPKKPKELCDLAVFSISELNLVHLAAEEYAERYKAPEPLSKALEEIGRPRMDVYQARSRFVVLRLEAEAHYSMEPVRGLDQGMVNLLIRARTKLDSVHESWNQKKDGPLLNLLEERYEDAKEALDAHESLQNGIILAQKYYSELKRQRDRTLETLESRSTARSITTSSRGNVRMNPHTSPSWNSLQVRAEDDAMSAFGLDPTQPPSSRGSSSPQQSSVRTENSQLAKLMTSVFSPLNIE